MIVIQIQNKKSTLVTLHTSAYYNNPKNSAFLFKNSKESTFSGLREFLNLVTVSPTVENNLSLGVEVAGIQSNDLATLDRCGNWDSFCFHHSKGCASHGIGFSAKYSVSWVSHPSSMESSFSSPSKISIAVFFFF